MGLEYIHTNEVIHKDIKPENLVLDSKGYVKITDFGIAKIFQENNASENSGTPGYMAPEVLCSQNHTFAVDYFAVGVIAYEFMKGFRPYHGRTRKEIKNDVLAKQVVISKEEMPENWSIESADCINRLLQRKPTKRLGSRGATEVKEHSWFKYYPWKDLYLQKLTSPFIPEKEDNFDEKYCNHDDPDGVQTIERYIKIISSSKYKKIFKNFNYFNREEEEKESHNSKNKKFVNPHLIYLEGNEDTEGDFDASVINRNILNGINIQKELLSQMTSLPRVRMLSAYPNSANKIRKGRNNNFDGTPSKVNNKIRNFSNEDNNRSFNLSLGGMKKYSKESGFGY